MVFHVNFFIVSIQDSYNVGYTYNNTAGNEVAVNVSCQNPSSSFCEIQMPGVPGQVYPIRVYSVLDGVLSAPMETKHSTSKEMFP